MITYFNSGVRTKALYLFKHYRLGSSYDTVMDRVLRNIRSSVNYGLFSDGMIWAKPDARSDFMDRGLLQGQGLKYPMHSLGYSPRTHNHRLYYMIPEMNSPFPAKYWLISQDFDSNWKLTDTITHGIDIETTPAVRDRIVDSIPPEVDLPPTVNISEKQGVYTVGIRHSTE